MHPIITSTFRLAVPFWRDAPQRHAAWLLALVLVSLVATSTGLNAWLNHFNKAFYDALLSKPDILFLDEASSALDNASEATMYQLIVDRFPDCTLVSIAHRTTLDSFHVKRLNLGAAAAAAVA